MQTFPLRKQVSVCRQNDHRTASSKFGSHENWRFCNSVRNKLILYSSSLEVLQSSADKAAVFLTNFPLRTEFLLCEIHISASTKPVIISNLNPHKICATDVILVLALKKVSPEHDPVFLSLTV